MTNQKAFRPTANGLYHPDFEHDACGMGFVAHIRGEKSRSIIEDALEVLCRLTHRGASGSDADTGDGAGILLQIPHRFFKRKGVELGMDMPHRRRYGVGMVFLPNDPKIRQQIEEIFDAVIAEEGQRLLGWRDVPTCPEVLGRAARDAMPTIRQVYVSRRRLAPSAFERKLYVIRKLVENRVAALGLDREGTFHVASLSAETIVYKGLLLPDQLARFYPDLHEADMVSAIAVVHSRFSTNTFPTWELAQPFRFIAHNGEINTVRGNRNSMTARRALLQSAKFGGSLERLFPIIVPGKSDSAQFDNMLELLVLGGRSLPMAMMMMIPEAWDQNELMDEERRAFYQYSSSLMEPWDGPAAIVFTDGHLVGGTLDRNGLRPARYLVTHDDRVILASETGVLDVPPERVRKKGRLTPGKMLLVDTTDGRIVQDEEAKRDLSSRWPYKRWLEKNTYPLDSLSPAEARTPLRDDALLQMQRAFGYTDEDLQKIIEPMAKTGKEPIGSMGTDTPLAVLSSQSPTLFSYFHQLFAQVTNPPIDPVRESLVMTLQTAIGPDGNTFEETPEQCHRITMPGPILTSEQLETLAQVEDIGVFEPKRISLLYDISNGRDDLEKAVEALVEQSVEAVAEGHNLLVLSDRGVDDKRAAIPSLLALSAVHHQLVREGIRHHTGLVVETAEAREVHHFALLIGYGAAAVNPWLALDSIRELAQTQPDWPDAAEAVRRYIQAVHDGLLKVLSKMGISTIQSYRGAQIFEAVGLEKNLVARCFTGTPSRLSGIGFAELDEEIKARHRTGFSPSVALPDGELPTGGYYQWRRKGEVHKWNPATIAKLQAAVQTQDLEASRELFRAYAELADNESEAHVNLRSLVAFSSAEDEQAIPLNDVESAESIAKRFVTGAMSFGSISAEAHETLAIAMNRLGGKSNSGEGGEEARRYQPDANGDLRRSAIKQVASGRFGVTAEYLVNADEIQIKMAQGAKPGEGGQLPGHKVDARIAKARHSTPGVTLISPPPHHDIYSIEDLSQLVFDLQSVHPEARVSVKLVSEAGVGTVAAGVAKSGAGGVVISGYEGGTGASPLSSIKRAGLPWELGLAETQQVLVQNDLRARIRVQVDGGLRTPRDVVVAALLGAEEFGLATASLISAGCVMLRKCHLNTCSVGIATQDPELRKKFTGKAEHVVRFFMLLAQGVREHMAQLGFRSFDDMVGQVERLKKREDLTHEKAKRLDLSPLLAPPMAPAEAFRSCQKEQRKDLSQHLDHRLLSRVNRALTRQEPTRIEMGITNVDRAVGAMLAGEIARRYASQGLPDDTLHLKFSGSAGQSFGAFSPKGVCLELEGDANDYLGKALSGGRIVVYPPRASQIPPEENILVGNTLLYGATAGDAYLNGIAGERFAVRNSGARAVVEGVGDHGCEYMTGGVVVILGAVGRNFAAGMSGGVAYVLDRERQLKERVNRDMVELEPIDPETDGWLVRGLLETHVALTSSPLGKRVLAQWDLILPDFVKVMPIEYKRLLQQQRTQASDEVRARLRVVGG